MLAIALTQIYDQLRDFFVAEIDGRIVGCGALHIAWENLGEIRSLAVAEDARKLGVGTRLVRQLMEAAHEIGVDKIFVLTYQTKFFEKLNFRVIGKDVLPHKIWRACLNCPKFPNCDETAMIQEAADTSTVPASGNPL